MSEEKKLKTGITTGTAATAAAKGALIKILKGVIPDKVDVVLPDKRILEIPLILKNDMVGVKKWSGDDPDVTDGIEIFAKVDFTKDDGVVQIKGGEGVGVATKPGLQIKVGEAAINPAPRRMIEENLKPLLPEGVGVKVTIIVPDGLKIAEKTFNSRLGIVGGISIIGTTGIVKPMSLEALIQTIKCEIDVLLASKVKDIWLVPGNIGEKCLKVFMDIETVIVSNYFEDALSYLRERQVEKVGIAGHPGKIAKLAMGYFNTHSKNSPQANSYIKNVLNVDDDFNTVEEICDKYCFDKIAEEVSKKVKERYGFSKVNVILFDMKCRLVGKFYD
ncbi:cobalt-precorrin-5B (C(1))-methyltransferase CbiD [Deferribacter abyssi]|uniref:cobalt-precorrin-5B (C(1))-methyltransferase CbiD n=1 Tax=Deferribacter abyssi TaxID=213806 RepID=UPI003C253BCD